MDFFFPTNKQRKPPISHTRVLCVKLVGIRSFLPQALRRRSLRRYVDHCVGLDGWNYPTLVRWALGAWFLGWMCFDIPPWKPWKSRVGSDVSCIEIVPFGNMLIFGRVLICLVFWKGELITFIESSWTVRRSKFWWSNMSLQRDHCICSMLLVKRCRIKNWKQITIKGLEKHLLLPSYTWHESKI